MKTTTPLLFALLLPPRRNRTTTAHRGASYQEIFDQRRQGQGPLNAAGLMVGKTAYVAGKGDYSPKADFAEKVKNCLNEVRKTLQVGGLDMQHVVQSWVYLENEDTGKFAEFNKVYGEVFKNDPPKYARRSASSGCQANRT